MEFSGCPSLGLSKALNSIGSSEAHRPRLKYPSPNLRDQGIFHFAQVPSPRRLAPTLRRAYKKTGLLSTTPLPPKRFKKLCPPNSISSTNSRKL